MEIRRFHIIVQILGTGCPSCKLLKESLGLHSNNKLRRKALLSKIKNRKYPETGSVDPVQLIGKDRER